MTNVVTEEYWEWPKIHSAAFSLLIGAGFALINFTLQFPILLMDKTRQSLKIVFTFINLCGAVATISRYETDLKNTKNRT